MSAQPLSQTWSEAEVVSRRESLVPRRESLGAVSRRESLGELAAQQLLRSKSSLISPMLLRGGSLRSPEYRLITQASSLVSRLPQGDPGEYPSENLLVIKSAMPLLLAVAGVSIAPLPCAISLSGIPGGVFLLVLLACINCYTSILLATAASRVGNFGYEEIMGLRGPCSQNISRIALIVMLFGTLCGSLSVVWETGKHGARFIWGLDAWLADDGIGGLTLLVILCFGVLLPLSLARLGEIFAISLIGITLSLVVTVYTLYTAVSTGGFSEPLVAAELTPVWTELPTTASLIGFAFWVQPVVLPLMEELPPGPVGVRIMTRALCLTYFCTALIYGSIGLGGFLAFGAATPQDILDGFSGTAGDMLACVFCIYVILSTPPVVVPLREVIERLITARGSRPGPRPMRRHLPVEQLIDAALDSRWGGGGSSAGADSPRLDVRDRDPASPYEPASPSGSSSPLSPWPLLPPPPRRVAISERFRALGKRIQDLIITSLLLGAVFIVVVTLPGASATFFNVTGASGVCLICYVFPVLAYWWTLTPRATGGSLVISWAVDYALPAAVLLLTISISTLALISTFQSLASDSTICSEADFFGPPPSGPPPSGPPIR